MTPTGFTLNTALRARALLGLALLAAGLALSQARAAQGTTTRLKDLVLFAGARDNQLVGYGLVVGLANDGDRNPTYTVQSMANLLQRFGVTVSPSTLSAKNVAAVMVTADIPAFARNGSRLDVHVAAMGDAKNLQGGLLLQTPLHGADEKVYAVAQGPLSIGGFSAGTGGPGGATVQKNHPTVAQIPGGALVELEIPAQIVQDNTLELMLREPDFTSAARMAAAINERFPEAAAATDSATVRVQIPEGIQGTPVDFIARLEAIEITPDVPARVIINERTGTIVATSRIKIAACAVSHGDLTITIASSLDVSQPAPFSSTGQTAVTPRTDTRVAEAKAKLIVLQEMPTIEKVAAGMNAIGVTPRDMMAIFQAMRQAGALQAEVILR